MNDEGKIKEERERKKKQKTVIIKSSRDTREDGGPSYILVFGGFTVELISIKKIIRTIIIIQRSQLKSYIIHRVG